MALEVRVTAKLGQREKRHRLAQIADALVRVAKDRRLLRRQPSLPERRSVFIVQTDVPVEPGHRRLPPLQHRAQRRIALFHEAVEPLQPGVIAPLGGFQHRDKLRDGQTT